MTIVTLSYHIINRSIDDKIAISEELFEQHLRYLHHEGYSTLSLEQVSAIVNGTMQAPPRAVLLTFDDAYQDNARVVLPLLKTYGMRATEFVISAYIGQTNRWNPRAGYDTGHMTWNDLRAWLDSGCDLGGHSHRHLCMTRLSRDELEETVGVNKFVLEERLGVSLRAFAYPYGKYSEGVQEIVRRYYELAFAVDLGTWDALADRYAINRLNISPMWSVDYLAQQLTGAMNCAPTNRYQAG